MEILVKSPGETWIIGCEESQEVCCAINQNTPHTAYSCDLEEGSRDPAHHIQGDIFKVLRKYNHLFDAGIFFPPCTHLAVSGAAHFAQKRRDGRQQAGVNFFMRLAWLDMPYVIENPVGIMSSKWRKPDQIIQPWQYGHKEKKATCLWVNKFPILTPTNIVGPPPSKKGKTPEQRRAIEREWEKVWSTSPGPERAKIRSKTYPGVARAMALQYM